VLTKDKPAHEQQIFKSDAWVGADARCAPESPLGAAIDARRLVRVFARRGAIFIKIGQFLATRPDLIPQAYCDELLKLTDQVAPFPWADARRILSEDLGAPPETLFEWINERPMAAASLSQVHVARARGGSEVVIKIQRPGIADLVRRQLRTARWLLRFLEVSGTLPGLSTRDLEHEITDWMVEELDFHKELSKIERMFTTYDGKVDFRVPRPYPELSGARVVVMSYLRGTPFSELLSMATRGNRGRLEVLGFDVEALSRRLVTAQLDQIFRYRLFHGDPHPGNVLAMEGGVIGFVDFGLVHVLDVKVQKRLSVYIEAIYRGDADLIYIALLDILERDDGADLEGFRSDLSEATRIWTRDAALGRAVPGARSPFAGYMIEVLQAARRNHLRIPASALAMYRSMLTADSVASALGSADALSKVGRRFFEDLRLEQFIEALSPDRAKAVAFELISATSAAPEQFGRILAELAEGRFVLSVRASDSQEDRRDANLRAKLLTMAVASVGLAVLLAAALASGVGKRTLLVLALLWLASNFTVLVLWRRIR